jgi:hypothetical protein
MLLISVPVTYFGGIKLMANKKLIIKHVVEDVSNVEDFKEGKYKKTDTPFTYLKKDTYDKIIQDDDEQINMLGSLVLKPYDPQQSDKRRDDIAVFEKEAVDENNNPVTGIGLITEIRTRKKFFWYTKGYLKVGPQAYVQYCKNWFILLILFLALLGGCLFGVVTIYKHINQPAPYVEEDPNYDEDQQDWDNQNPKSGKDSVASADSTKFPGYSVLTIEDKNGTIDLGNPSENTVDFTYTILDSEGNELYTTSKIRPGKYVPLAVGKLYSSAGSYDITFDIRTYDVDTGAECTSVTMPVTLVVEK